MIARRFLVRGRVQGVFYRAWTVATARELGLTGWVRNRADGSVEILACGAPGALDTLLERCWTGPAHAQVTGIEVSEAELEPVTGFEKRPTL